MQCGVQVDPVASNVGAGLTLAVAALVLVFGRARTNRVQLGFSRNTALWVALAGGALGVATAIGVVLLLDHVAYVPCWAVILGPIGGAVAADVLTTLLISRLRSLDHPSLVPVTVMSAAAWWGAAVIVCWVGADLTLGVAVTAEP
jgi:hypothetical protein